MLCEVTRSTINHHIQLKDGSAIITTQLDQVCDLPLPL